MELGLANLQAVFVVALVVAWEDDWRHGLYRGGILIPFRLILFNTLIVHAFFRKLLSIRWGRSLSSTVNLS